VASNSKSVADITEEIDPTAKRKHPAAMCERCPLFRRPAAVSEIRPGAPLVIVGEAPAVEEVVQGRAFVGNSGRVLWGVLQQIGIRRPQVSVLNAAMCRGKDNKVPQSALDACRPRLIQELEEASPELVVALGNSALTSIMHDTKLKITASRGSLGGVRQSPEGHKVWATIHPASLLYSPAGFPDFASDLSKIPDILSGAYDKEDDSDSFTFTEVDDVTSMRDLLELMRSLPEGTVVSCDDETTGFDYNQDDILCVALSFEHSHAYVVGPTICDDPELMQELFSLDHLQWVYHNSKFDAQFERAKYKLRVPVHHDTMMMSYALDERQGVHSLKHLAREHEKAPDYEKVLAEFVRTKNDTFAKVPKPILHKYAAFDAIYTRRLHHTLLEKVRADGTEEFYNNVLMPATNWFLDVELNGMLVDIKGIERLGVEMNERIGKIVTELYELAETEFNPNSPQQVAAVLYDRMHIRIPYKYGRSTKDEVLELIEHPIARKMQEYREWAKLNSTYVKGIDSTIWADDRVHPSYWIHGAVSRTSCKNPNIQNVPRGPMIRSIFVAPPGYKFVSIDFSQHEFRMLAAYSKDPWLTEVFSRGLSLHKEAAKARYGDEYNVEQYTHVKTFNFGIIYQRGEFSLAQEFGISLSAARDMIDDFWSRMPLAYEWTQQQKKTVLVEGELQSMLGRRRRFGLITRENEEDILKQAVNFPLQSTGSDTCLMAGHAVHFSGKFAPDEVIPVGFVHDSVLYYIREDLVDKIVPEICAIMEAVPQRALGTDVRFQVEAKIGDSWGDAEQ
jgi:DNA polymerase I